jgi:hypothetical protein
MTEEQIRAIIAAAFTKASADAAALIDPERNIQVDTMMAALRDICEGVATAVTSP